MENRQSMNSIRETAVGLFVLIGLLCLAYMTVKLGKMQLWHDQGFELSAYFDSVSGLRVGADVEMAGVPVGRVVSISLDPDPVRNQALVRLRLNRDLQLSEDSMASIRTNGLIGDKFISLSRGGSEQILSAGSFITETESAVDLGSLISKYAFGGVK
jgi:phospholipid/cholesterol/gamma-HCH transport system substrate-binding protein